MIVDRGRRACWPSEDLEASGRFLYTIARDDRGFPPKPDLRQRRHDLRHHKHRIVDDLRKKGVAFIACEVGHMAVHKFEVA